MDKKLMRTAGRLVLGCAFSAILLAILLLGVSGEIGTVRAASQVQLWHQQGFPPGETFLYAVDRASGAFVFTYTLPTLNVGIGDIAVATQGGQQAVWFTQPSVDRLGMLVYTNTTQYLYREYTVTVGSYPLNLTTGNGYIWFTAPGRNQIGRLNPVDGHVDEFVVPTPNSYPANLALASDGSLWFTQMQADKIARLVITDTTDYVIHEYYTDTLSGGRPYGIAISGQSIWVAATATNKIIRFTPPNSWVTPGTLVSFDEPYALAAISGNDVWIAERRGNRITRFFIGTFPVAAPYDLSPLHSLPTALVRDTQNQVWFTQSGAGRIGKLTPTSPATLEYYPLPMQGLSPTSIATGNDSSIWVLAYRPHRIYLPLVLRSHN